MELKKALLAGISVTALVMAAPAVTLAGDAIDDVRGNSDSNDQDVDVGSDNGNGGHHDYEGPYNYRSGGDGFDDRNAVAVAALQQNSVQIVASEHDEAIDDNYDADMDFGESTFQNQTLNNNNFNTGVNALQGNAMAIVGSSNRGLGVE